MARGEQIQERRRRRSDDALQGVRRRLHVNEAELDRANYEYYWANDEGNRIHALTVQDDWEVVPDRAGEVRADGSGMGAEIAVPVGTGEKGPIRAVFLRKPRKFYDDDKAAANRRIDELEASLKTGSVPGAAGELSVPRSAPIEWSHRDKG